MEMDSKLGVAVIGLVSPVLRFGRVAGGNVRAGMTEADGTNVGAVTSGTRAVFDTCFVTAIALEVWLEAEKVEM